VKIEAGFGFKAQSASEVRDLNFELLPGLTLDPGAVPPCTYGDLTEGTCPNSAAVGVVRMSVAGIVVPAAVYDLVPAPGEPAELGFTLKGTPVIVAVAVRTGSDYGITMSILNIPQDEVESVKLTLWGVPSDPSHNALRGSCATGGGTCPSEAPPEVFLTLPTACAGPLQTTLQGESWGTEAVSLPVSFPQMSGCEKLDFSPTIEVVPDKSEADTPTGFTVRLRVPQETSRNPVGLAESDVRNAKIELPDGMQLNPSIEAGAKIATVRIDTPLLLNPLEGAVYLAVPQNGPSPFEEVENQPGFVAGIYIVAEDPVAGVLVKLPATLTRDPVSGQLVIELEDMPQLPIEETEIHFFGGERAPFSTPALCGLYTTTASFAPWSTLPGGTSSSAVTAASSSFEINTGPDGSGPAGCPAPTQSGGGSESSVDGGSSGSGGGSSAAATATALPASLADPTPLVTLAGSKLVVSGGLAPVSVKCQAAACQGSVELTVQVPVKDGVGKTAAAHKTTLVLATGHFSLAEGKNGSVLLRLTSAGRQRLAHARRHPIPAKLILSVKGGKTATKSVLAV
jgi:hypothetical protein